MTCALVSRSCTPAKWWSSARHQNSKRALAAATRHWTMYSFILPATRWNQEEVSVKPHANDTWRNDWVEPVATNTTGIFAPLIGFVDKTMVITELEVRRLRHDFTEVAARAIQPALWLLLFGEVFTKVRAISTGDVPYLDFMAPGILAQSVLFVAIFYGISIIWERDLGILHKFLVSPTPRGALVLGKALSAGVRSLSQAVIIYVLALLLGVQVNWHPAALIGVVVTVILGAAMFSTLSLIIASVAKTRERFMGMGQVLTM